MRHGLNEARCTSVNNAAGRNPGADGHVQESDDVNYLYEPDSLNLCEKNKEKRDEIR